MPSKQAAAARKPAYGRAKQHFFRSLDLADVITPSQGGEGDFTATKLVCSLGPSSHSVQVLEAMLRAGMVAARIDLTWGGLEFHRKSLQALNQAMANTCRLCAVVVETLGREILVRRPCVFAEDGWPAHPDPLSISQGQTLTLTTRADAEPSADLLPVTYGHLHHMCEAGDTIYIGRYLSAGVDAVSLYLKVKAVEGQDIICEAQNSAVMDGLMTVFHMERSDDSLLNLQNNLPLLSEYDQEAIAALGAEFEVDFLSLAYTRTREDVREARAFLDGAGMGSTRLLAKIETRQALLNFRGILATADGVVLSRGNLGLDVAPEKMALVQKQLISNCNLLGKPVLINRVVDSMVDNPRPTRAEATDIANAVLDGVDGILMGAETLRGLFPVDAVATIAQICRVAEEVFDYSSHYDHLMGAAQDMEAAVRAAAAGHEHHHHHHQHHHAGHGHSSGGGGGAGDVAANGGLQASHGGGGSASKSVAFAAGSEAGDPDESSSVADGVSPASSFGDMTALGASAAAMMGSGSFSNLQAAYEEVHAFTKYGGAGARSVANFPQSRSTGSLAYASQGVAVMSKLESLASSAVRSAGNVGADMIVVYTATGRTAQLVAKYRPPMPILTLVVPRLVNDGIKWRLEGRSTARACQLTRGLLPMLATPGPNGDAVLEAAVVQAARSGLVAPRHHVVVLQQVHDDFCVKIMSLDSSGRRIVGPTSSGITRSVSTAAGAKLASKRAASAGELVDSDDEAAAVEDDAPCLLAGGGSFQVSPSVMYSPQAAKAIAKAVKGGGGGNGSGAPALQTTGVGVTGAPGGAGCSPTTPAKPGSAGK